MVINPQTCHRCDRGVAELLSGKSFGALHVSLGAAASKVSGDRMTHMRTMVLEDLATKLSHFGVNVGKSSMEQLGDGVSERRFFFGG